jgi:hypothetical protein
MDEDYGPFEALRYTCERNPHHGIYGDVRISELVVKHAKFQDGLTERIHNP